MNEARLLVVVLMLLSAAALPTHALGAQPPKNPILRVESGMHTAPIVSIASDAAGRYLVTGSLDKTVRVWDAMSPDGTTIAAAGNTGSWDTSSSIYLFDRTTGRVIRRIPGLAVTMTTALAYSRDGRYLAAGAKGLWVFRAKDGNEVGRDTSYGDEVGSLDFGRNGQLISTSLDQYARLYSVTEHALRLTRKEHALDGPQSSIARFSPDGTRIAILSWRNVAVVASRDLSELYSPSTEGLGNTLFSTVAWSRDGARLYAAGATSPTADRRAVIGSWTNGGQGPFTVWPASERDGVSDGVVFSLVALKDGALAYNALRGIGVVDPSERKRWEQRATTADFTADDNEVTLSHDGMVVQFGFERPALSPGAVRVAFDVADRTLRPADGTGSSRTPPSSEPGFELFSRGALAPDRESAVVPINAKDGEVLRRIGREGGALWSVKLGSFLGTANISGAGRFVVTALADGTIRWYRMKDGKEVLAFFPHTDQKRWVLWSPSGYYDASPGAEDLIGWHVNRGPDDSADFYPASRFRSTFYRPDVVTKLLETGDEVEAVRLANEEAGRGRQAIAVEQALPPVVEIVSPADGAAVSSSDVRLSFMVRTAANAPVLSLRARVNGQPVNVPARRDIAVEGRAGTAKDVTITIPAHDSEIMLFAENRYGVSVPAVVGLRWVGSRSRTEAGAEFVAKPKLYILAIGVSKYQESA